MQTTWMGVGIFGVIMGLVAIVSLPFILAGPLSLTSLKSHIPSEIALGRAIDGHTDISYSYGLFEIDETVAVKIKTDGLAFLSSLTHGRDPKRRLQGWGTDTCSISLPEYEAGWNHRSAKHRVRFDTGQRTGTSYSVRGYYGACIVVLPDERLIAVKWAD